MKDLIKEYKENFAFHLKNRKLFFENDVDKFEIVLKAALSFNNEGKMFSHQHRVGKKRAEQAAKELIKYEYEIFSAKSFEDIFYFTELVRMSIKGVGDLWSYDTALHIGFKLGFYPSEVYIQSGVKRGLKIFYPNMNLKRKINKSFFKGLDNFEPYEIENFLCTMSKKVKFKEKYFSL